MPSGGFGKVKMKNLRLALSRRAGTPQPLPLGVGRRGMSMGDLEFEDWKEIPVGPGQQDPTRDGSSGVHLAGELRARRGRSGVRELHVLAGFEPSERDELPDPIPRRAGVTVSSSEAPSMCGTSIRAKVNHAIAVGGSPFTYTHGVSADTVIERQAGIVFLTLTGVTLRPSS